MMRSSMVLSYSLSHKPDDDTVSKLLVPLRCSVSIFSNFDSKAADSGLNVVVINAPISMDMMRDGARNCHADIPDALATMSSFVRVSFVKLNMPPSSIVNGITSCTICGSFNITSCNITKEGSSLPWPRRIISTASIIIIRVISAMKITAVFIRNCFPM